MKSVLEAQHVTRIFGGGLLTEGHTVAVDGVSLIVNEDKPSITAIAGESGSGKTTLARLLLGIIQPTSGSILYQGRPLTALDDRSRKQFRREVQAIFQDPYEAYNPVYKVDQTLTTPVNKFRLFRSKEEAQLRIEESLRLAGLRPEETLGRYPHQLSGGQRQRIMVARALLLNPRVLLADSCSRSTPSNSTSPPSITAGYYRGWADTMFSSFADVMLVIPALAILITVSAYVRVVTVELMAVIIGLLSWPLTARVIRSQTLSLRERLFVQVARLSGQNDFEIITLQILPNLTAYLAASFVGAVSAGILAAVGLEVLGLGPQTVPTIGRTLYNSFRYTALFRGMFWWWGPPVVTLAIIFSGLFMMSMALDKYANPRLKGSAGG